MVSGQALSNRVASMISRRKGTLRAVFRSRWSANSTRVGSSRLPLASAMELVIFGPVGLKKAIIPGDRIAVDGTWGEHLRGLVSLRVEAS